MMKLLELRLKGFQQFRDITINFTHPQTGAPLVKVCFIGRNGTGKSTLLQQLFRLLSEAPPYRNFPSFLLAKYQLANQKIYGCVYNQNLSAFFKEGIDQHNGWMDDLYAWASNDPAHLILKAKRKYGQYFLETSLDVLALKPNSNDLCIWVPPETAQNQYMTVTDLPQANVEKAHETYGIFQPVHTVSNETVSEFWGLLIYLLNKRREENDAFEQSPENLDKTKRVLMAEFDKKHPKVLEGLAEYWDKILDCAGLYFDAQNAKTPYQLKDNLRAYIRFKANEAPLQYSGLSTGIRNYLFKIGHLYALYFNRKIERGFLLVDEPENSLFPDFLFELVEVYEQILTGKNTQFFVSTHSPIIAAQFEPYERKVLEWNDDGSVSVSDGKAPAGDDPNDVLEKDFGLPQLMGAKGLQKWEEYVSLIGQIHQETNEASKNKLIKKRREIGDLYNF